MFPARLPIVGKSWLSVNLTVAARLMHVSAPGARRGGVKSVNLCELSVPGTEARCRANHGSARCSRAGATAGGRTEMMTSTCRDALNGIRLQALLCTTVQ